MSEIVWPDEPDPEDVRAFQQMAEHNRQIWRALKPTSPLRLVCERMDDALGDYFHNGGPPPP